MAVSLLERPIGHILSSTVNVATVSNSGGDALFTDSSHGLVDGDYIYILCNIEDYNGFWYVDQQSTDTFKVKRYSSASAQTFKQVVSVDYYVSETQHGWQCVHLPITYRLSNTLWPTNSADTTRTISSFTNDNGYVNLNLSGSLGTFDELTFIKISGTGDEDLDGVYQIIDKISTSDVTISLSYASTLDLLGGSVQLYYSSYNIVVEVYAGLNSGHYWASEKPYELAATLNLIPDSNNQVFFSISEILKSYVETKNNLLGGTLPNDITQFVQFYIKFGESYDFANGYSISTLESALTDDSSNFEGYAVNAKLPFKNIHSGHLTEYYMNRATAKFLTLFTIPVIFLNCEDETQSISFINPFDSSYQITMREQYYLNGQLQETLNTVIPSADKGVIRFFLDNATCIYDTVYCGLFLTGVPNFINGTFTGNINNWSNTGSGQDWIYLTNNAQVTVTGSQQSKRFEQDYDFIPNVSYNISFDLTTDGTDLAGWIVSAYATDDTYSSTQTILSSGPYTSATSVTLSTSSFVPTKAYTKFYILVTPNTP